MAFFGSPTNSSFGNPNDLVAQARRAGMSDDQIMQLLLESGMDPNAADLNVPAAPLSSAPPSIIPRQELQTLAASEFAMPTRDLAYRGEDPQATDLLMRSAPPQPTKIDNARVGTGDDNYDDLTFNSRIAAAADAYGVDPDIARGLFDVENAQRNPYATNPNSTAVGLGQLTDAAREDYNKAHGTNFTREDFFDPDLNADATMWYLTTRDGQTIQDQLRAYNQGNRGAALGRGKGYADAVMAAAGMPASPMTGSDGTSMAAAPQAYDELDEEVMPPSPEQVLLPGEGGNTLLAAEPEGGLSSDPKESPNFIQKLMGALSGPLGEGLMGMGAGILGARGTYGNTFQAIGQGGQQGLEAYGYAQRRAQREREAQAELKRQEAKDKEATAEREQSALQTDISLVQTLTKNRQYKAAAAYIARSPRLRERFGADVTPSFFAGSADKPDIHFYPDRIIAVDKDTLQATEIKVPGAPLKKPDDVNGIVTVMKGRKVLMHPRSGEIIKDLGADDGGNVNGVVRTELNDRGQPVNRLYNPRTGELISELGVPYDDSQSVEIQNPDGTVMRVGKPQKGTRSGLPQARENRLWEVYDTWQNAKFAGEMLIGTKGEDGVYRGGAVNKFDIGLLGDLRKYTFGALSQADAATQLLGSSLEQGANRFVEQNMKRSPRPGDKGKGVFTQSRWFNPNQPIIEYYGNMLAAIEAMSKNPDGRISDADMEIARRTLSLEGDWFTNIDVVRTKVAESIRFAEQKGLRAAQALKIDPETGYPLDDTGTPAKPSPDETKDELPLSQTPGPPPPPPEATPSLPTAAEIDKVRKSAKKGEVVLFNPNNPPGKQLGVGAAEDATGGWQVVP